jgi:ABC-type phosphate transport system ATPase subunit
MGPSGSGKTTFLNIISGRCKSNNTLKIEGSVCLNNNSINTVDISRISS